MEFEVLGLLENKYTEVAFGLGREKNVFVNGQPTDIYLQNIDDVKDSAIALEKELLKKKFLKKL